MPQKLDNRPFQIYAEAVFWTQLAGEDFKKFFRQVRQHDITQKTTPFDIVTEADKAIEEHFLRNITSQHPDHGIISEEAGSINPDAEWVWVIDPIDGTTNFANRIPHANISVGVKHKGKTRFAVVYDPILDHTFMADDGPFAAVNAENIFTGEKSRLEDAVVATGFPSDRATNPDNNLDVAARVAKRVRGLRVLGSAALDICYVAAGWLDAFWETDLHEWDICAAKLIAQKAGAVVTEFRTDRRNSILVANRELTEQLLPIITQKE